MRKRGNPVASGPEPIHRPVADGLAEGLVRCRDGIVVWASEPFARLAGAASAAALLDRPFAGLFADGGAGLPGDAAGAPSDVECLLRDGSVGRPVRVRRVRDEKGAPGDVTWVVEDESRLRVLEEELLRTSRALHRAQRELEGLRERHRREAAEREQLLTVVSHELRTPVTVIAGYARLLLSEKVGPLNDDQRRFLHESAKSCQRLSSFIGNLLEAARDVTADGALEVCEASLAPTIEGVVTFLKPLLEEHRLAIRLALHPADPRARFDPLRVEQVLTNLIGNAIKYAQPGGSIEISTRPVEYGKGAGARPGVEVAVCDDGPGVAAADRVRIFEAYVRAGEASRAGGLGLGLAICKRIVEAHGGEIGVTEGPGGVGARFAFTLPAADGAAARSERR